MEESHLSLLVMSKQLSSPSREMVTQFASGFAGLTKPSFTLGLSLYEPRFGFSLFEPRERGSKKIKMISWICRLLQAGQGGFGFLSQTGFGSAGGNILQ
jgi:hypothetical protein